MGKAIFVMARTKDFDQDEVLAKAAVLFWNKGYNGTSMQELVDYLGISRSSLYDTYGDKHSLYLKALEYYQHTAGNEMCSLIKQANSVREAIKKLLEYTVNQLVGDAEHKGCFMVNAEVEVATHDAEVKDIVCKNEQQISEVFHNLIEKGQQSGEITQKQDATALTRFILNNIKGMRVSAKSIADRHYFADIINTTLLALD